MSRPDTLKQIEQRISAAPAGSSFMSRDWIENSYDTIETHYGSVDNFLKKKVGLSEKDIQKLQKAYLE